MCSGQRWLLRMQFIKTSSSCSCALSPRRRQIAVIWLSRKALLESGPELLWSVNCTKCEFFEWSNKIHLRSADWSNGYRVTVRDEGCESLDSRLSSQDLPGRLQLERLLEEPQLETTTRRLESCLLDWNDRIVFGCRRSRARESRTEDLSTSPY